jgi:hypothetical protein
MRRPEAEGINCGLDTCLGKLRKTTVSFFYENMLVVQSI